MKTLDYVKLGLLAAILVLVFLDYRCCVRANSCCNESSQMQVMDDSVPSKIPAKTTLLPQLSATSIIVIYDFHTGGETGNADSRLEGVDVDIYKQTVDGLYDPRQHATKVTDVNGEVSLRNGLGIGNYLVIATDKKNGVSNEMRITLEKSIVDTIYLPLNLKCGINAKEEPTVNVEPVVKEVAK